MSSRQVNEGPGSRDRRPEANGRHQLDYAVSWLSANGSVWVSPRVIDLPLLLKSQRTASLALRRSGLNNYAWSMKRQPMARGCTPVTLLCRADQGI